MNPITCPSCGTENPASFRFCGGCGAPLERTCAACGASVPAGFRFCGACGGAVLDAPRPAAAVASEERKVVTALFADIAASTEMASRMDPEDLRAVLKPFFDAMADEIARYGGTVEKYIGDAVCAVFGAPVAHEDDPERAVRAGLAMHRRLDELNTELPEPLAMRVGIHTGEVVTVPGGPGEGLVAGGPVNIAARLQSAGRPGAVVIGERTRRDCRGAFVTRSLGRLELKGVGEPVLAFEVAGSTAARRATGRAQMIGRAGEMSLLALLLERTLRERRANLVTIVGPAGIGKSRLALEFERTATDAGARVLRGRCPPYGDGLTYWPLGEILKTDAGILDTDPAGDIVAKATARLRTLLPDQPQTAAVLLSSVGMSTEADTLAGMDPETARGLIARAWRTYLEALAASEPALIEIEDLHWADPSLLDVIEALAGRISGPVLIVCTARPDLWDRRAGWGGGLRNATSVELSPLSDEESSSLIAELLGSAPAGAVEAVLERAEGNPFFAMELVQMLVEDGILVRAADGWEVSRPMPSTLPDTVQGVIASRIDRLPADEKSVIQAAAVVGRVFWPGALARLGAPNAAPVLEALIAKGLIAEREETVMRGQRELAFNHILTRDVAYNSIPRARRSAAHAAVGAWMEEVHHDRVEEFAEVLAHHFTAAGDGARTARYAALAGHRRRRVFAADDAIRWYERALEATDEHDPAFLADVALARGQALEQLGRFPEAQQDYERALLTARKAGASTTEAQLLSALAHVYWLQDRYDEGRAVLGEALTAARAAGSSDLEARTLYTAGTMAFGHGDWREAISFHQQALAVASEAGDLFGRALAYHGLCETIYFVGPYEDALQNGLRAREAARTIGNRVLEFHNEYMAAFSLWFRGRLDEAGRSADAAIEANHDLGARRDEAFSHGARSAMHLSAGALGPALFHASEDLRLAADIRSPRLELVSRGVMLDVLIELDDRPAIASEVAECRRLQDEFGGEFLRARVVAYGALNVAYQGRRDEAHALFAEAMSQTTQLTDRLWAGTLAVQAWTTLGDREALRRAAERFLEYATEDAPLFRAWAIFGASAAALASRPGEAAARAAEAVALADRFGERRVAWRARLVMADALESIGRAGETAALRAEAARIVRESAATIDDLDLRAHFEARADVARALAGRG